MREFRDQARVQDAAKQSEDHGSDQVWTDSQNPASENQYVLGDPSSLPKDVPEYLPGNPITARVLGESETEAVSQLPLT